MIAAASMPASLHAPRESRQMVSLDVGDYKLALDAEDLIGVRDDGQIEELSVLGTTGVSRAAKLVRCPEGDIRAIDLIAFLNQSTKLDRNPLVLVKSHDQGNSDNPLGLFVEKTSRPQSIAEPDWHPVSDWIRNRISLPAHSFVIERDRSGIATSIRLVLDAGEFQHSSQTANRAPSQRRSNESPSQPPKSNSKSGRGLLVFAPAESARGQMKTALAVPMSFLMGVELESKIFKLPSHDPCVVGVTTWNQLPIPVLRLGDSLGLAQESRNSVSSAKRGQAMRMMILRTPENRIFGCMAHAQMRTLRGSAAKADQPNCDIPPECLLGSFLTEEGPLSIPDLDYLLQAKRK